MPTPSDSSARQPHPLTDLLLTVVIPSIVLEYLSKPDRLGPLWALVVALLLPLGFGVYCLVRKRGLNFFSVLGLIAIIFTGGLGLLNLSPAWFAAKEAAFPIFLGLAFPLSFYWNKPLVSELLLNPQIINHTQLNRALDTSEKHSQFRTLLHQASWGMAGSSFVSAVANCVLILYLMHGKTPGSPEYVKAIGTQNWLGLIVIGIPLVGVTMALLLWVLRRMQNITGLERDDLMNAGQTVRRQVG